MWQNVLFQIIHKQHGLFPHPLNMDHIPPVGKQFLEGGHTWEAFGPYLNHNVVRVDIRRIGVFHYHVRNVLSSG